MDNKEIEYFFKQQELEASVSKHGNDKSLKIGEISRDQYSVRDNFAKGEAEERKDLVQTLLSDPKKHWANSELLDFLKKEYKSLADNSEHTPIDAGKRKVVELFSDEVENQQENEENLER